MTRPQTAEARMNSALWGCLGLFAIAFAIIGGGAVIIFRILLL